MRTKYSTLTQYEFCRVLQDFLDKKLEIPADLAQEALNRLEGLAR